MGDAQRLFGGLLSGAGQGILEKAKADRAETLRRMTIEGQQGLIRNVVTDSSGKTFGISGGGEVKDLGIQQKVDGMSADKRAIYDRVVKRHTTDKGSFEGSVTDWDKVTSRLNKLGETALARISASMEGASSGITDPFDPLFLEAKKMAKDWASDKAGWTTSDKEDFKKWGTKTEAIAAKTMEFYNQIKSGGQDVSRGTPAAALNTGGQYKTPVDVKKAYISGALTRDQAGKILREQFAGYE